VALCGVLLVMPLEAELPSALAGAPPLVVADGATAPVPEPLAEEAPRLLADAPAGDAVLLEAPGELLPE